MCGKRKPKCAAAPLWLRRNPVIAPLISLLQLSISSLHPLGRRWMHSLLVLPEVNAEARSHLRRPAPKPTLVSRWDIWPVTAFTTPSAKTEDFSGFLTVNMVDFNETLCQAFSQISGCEFLANSEFLAVTNVFTRWEGPVGFSFGLQFFFFFFIDCQGKS